MTTIHCGESELVFEVPTTLVADWAHQGCTLRVDVAAKKGVAYDLAMIGTVITQTADRVCISFGGLLCSAPRSMFNGAQEVGVGASLNVAKLRANSHKRSLKPRT